MYLRLTKENRETVNNSKTASSLQYYASLAIIPIHKKERPLPHSKTRILYNVLLPKTPHERNEPSKT